MLIHFKTPSSFALKAREQWPIASFSDLTSPPSKRKRAQWINRAWYDTRELSGGLSPQDSGIRFKDSEDIIWPKLKPILNGNAEQRPGLSEGIDLCVVPLSLKNQDLAGLVDCLQAPKLDEKAHKLPLRCGDITKEIPSANRDKDALLRQTALGTLQANLLLQQTIPILNKLYKQVDPASAVLALAVRDTVQEACRPLSVGLRNSLEMFRDLRATMRRESAADIRPRDISTLLVEAPAVANKLFSTETQEARQVLVRSVTTAFRGRDNRPRYAQKKVVLGSPVGRIGREVGPWNSQRGTGSYRPYYRRSAGSFRGARPYFSSGHGQYSYAPNQYRQVYGRSFTRGSRGRGGRGSRSGTRPAGRRGQYKA